jgi:predicted Zn-dependent peptidase
MNAAASGRRSDQTPHRVEADKLGLLTIGEHRVRVVYDGWRQTVHRVQAQDVELR